MKHKEECIMCVLLQSQCIYAVQCKKRNLDISIQNVVAWDVTERTVTLTCQHH